MADRASCQLLNMKKKLGKFSPTFFCTYLLQLLSVSSLPSNPVLPRPVLVLVLVHVLESPCFSPPHNPFTGLTLTSPAQSLLSTSAAAFALVLTTNSALSPPLSTPQGSLGAVRILCQPIGMFLNPQPNPTQPLACAPNKSTNSIILHVHICI